MLLASSGETQEVRRMTKVIALWIHGRSHEPNQSPASRTISFRSMADWKRTLKHLCRLLLHLRAPPSRTKCKRRESWHRMPVHPEKRQRIRSAPLSSTIQSSQGITSNRLISNKTPRCLRSMRLPELAPTIPFAKFGKWKRWKAVTSTRCHQMRRSTTQRLTMQMISSNPRSLSIRSSANLRKASVKSTISLTSSMVISRSTKSWLMRLGRRWSHVRTRLAAARTTVHRVYLQTASTKKPKAVPSSLKIWAIMRNSFQRSARTWHKVTVILQPLWA